MKILMLCLGNICRSPVAEGVLRKKVTDLNLDWTIDSAGTSAYHAGEAPDPRSQEVALAHGIDISQQRSRALKPKDFAIFDLILAMDSQNYQDARKMAQGEEQKAKVQLIMNFERPHFNQAVPDPYWDDNGFELVYAMLDRACEALIQQLS